jgi:glycine/D-amino acid oxidase-like deaminating enzyme
MLQMTTGAERHDNPTQCCRQISSRDPSKLYLLDADHRRQLHIRRRRDRMMSDLFAVAHHSLSGGPMARFAGTRKTRKLPDDGVTNGWYATLPPPPEARRVQGTVNCDWAVIGAGACGLSVARRLAELRSGDSIAVIEAMRVGYGTSGRNAGFMLSHHSHGGFANPEVGRRNDRLFSTGYTYLRETVEKHQIRCDWSDWGQIYVAAGMEGAGHLDAVAQGFAGLDVDFNGIDRDAIEEITGTRYYGQGIRLQGAALVQPAAMMRGLGATLPENAVLYEESPVLELVGDGGFRLICPDGEVIAAKLILANHVFAEELRFERHRVVPIATFASLTRPLTDSEKSHVGSEGQFGLLPASPNGSTVRLTLDGRILMRNTLYYAREKSFSPELIATAENHHRQSLRARWPALAEVEFVATWGGIMGFTRNEGAIFGEIRDGLYAVLTTDAAPMTRGIATGKLLAEQLSGIDSEELRILQSVPKAAMLPPDPILRFVAERRIQKFADREAAER